MVNCKFGWSEARFSIRVCILQFLQIARESQSSNVKKLAHLITLRCIVSLYHLIFWPKPQISPLQINAFSPKLIAINISTLFVLNTILLLVESYRTFLSFSVDQTIQGAIYQKENNCPSDAYLKLGFTIFLSNIKIFRSKTSLQLEVL